MKIYIDIFKKATKNPETLIWKNIFVYVNVFMRMCICM